MRHLATGLVVLALVGFCGLAEAAKPKAPKAPKDPAAAKPAKVKGDKANKAAKPLTGEVVSVTPDPAKADCGEITVKSGGRKNATDTKVAYDKGVLSAELKKPGIRESAPAAAPGVRRWSGRGSSAERRRGGVAGRVKTGQSGAG